jgi:hypothetical protein
MQYADRSVNYAEKTFMKLANGVNFIELFGIINAPGGINLSQNL